MNLEEWWHNVTPEGRIKKQIKKLLDKYKGPVYYHMPVQNGMGRPTLDFIGWAAGVAFAIEAKAPDGKLTKRQQLTIIEMRDAGCNVFVIKDQFSLDHFNAWLDMTLQAAASGAPAVVKTASQVITMENFGLKVSRPVFRFVVESEGHASCKS